jgi:ribosomal protein L21
LLDARFYAIFEEVTQAMFAVVRTGGKQYRVAAGDKIAVEKLAGEAGDKITLGDVLLAGEDGNVADASKVSVSAEIIAQAKSEKVTPSRSAPAQLSPQARPSPADDPCCASLPWRGKEGRAEEGACREGGSACRRQR